jgi:hypothetical protein
MVGKEIFSMVEANKLEGSSNYVVWKVKMKVLPQRKTLQHCLSSYNCSCILNCVNFNCYYISNAEQYHFVGLEGLWICYIISICQRWNYIVYCWSRWSNQLLENFAKSLWTKNIARTLFLLNKHHILCMEEGFSIVEFMCNIKEATTLLGTVGELCKKRQ